MADHTYTVKAEWDADASVWVATSDDVPGLVTEAATLERLMEKSSTASLNAPRGLVGYG